MILWHHHALVTQKHKNLNDICDFLTTSLLQIDPLNEANTLLDSHWDPGAAVAACASDCLLYPTPDTSFLLLHSQI